MKEEKNSHNSNVNIKMLFSLTKGYKREFTVIIVSGIVSTVLTLIQPSLVANMIAKGSIDISNVVNIFTLVSVLFSSTILTAIQYYFLQIISENAVFKARKNLIGHLLRLPISDYGSTSIGDLLSGVNADPSKLRVAIVQISITLSSGLLMIVGASIQMFFRNALLFTVTISTVIIAFVGIVIMSKAIQKSSFFAQKDLGKLSGNLERDLHAIRTIRSTNSTRSEEEKNLLNAKRLRDRGIELAKIQSFMTPVSNMLLQLSGLIVLGIGGYLVATGKSSIADLTAFALLLYTIIGPIGQIFASLGGLGESLGALERIQSLMNLSLEGDLDTHISIPNATSVNLKGVSVYLDNVTFRYKKSELESDSVGNKDKAVLKDVKLRAEKGKRIAIVGPSGAGKSTILQLIERFYEPDFGRIYIDGEDYRNFDRESLRRRISYVEQDAPVLSGTLKENLTLGNVQVSDKACIDVIKQVNLDYLLNRSPKGLQMQVGEFGLLLSGGERQRLSLARSLLSSADIVLLDELTSNQDSLNEMEIKKTIDELKNKRTVIVVAHRLSTVMDSDVIYVLERGRIVGSGTHNELLDKVPLYKSLAEEQFVDSKI